MALPATSVQIPEPVQDGFGLKLTDMSGTSEFNKNISCPVWVAGGKAPDVVGDLDFGNKSITTGDEVCVWDNQVTADFKDLLKTPRRFSNHSLASLWHWRGTQNLFDNHWLPKITSILKRFMYCGILLALIITTNDLRFELHSGLFRLEIVATDPRESPDGKNRGPQIGSSLLLRQESPKQDFTKSPEGRLLANGVPDEDDPNLSSDTVVSQLFSKRNLRSKPNSETPVLHNHGRIIQASGVGRSERLLVNSLQRGFDSKLYAEQQKFSEIVDMSPEELPSVGDQLPTSDPNVSSYDDNFKRSQATISQQAKTFEDLKGKLEILAEASGKAEKAATEAARQMVEMKSAHSEKLSVAQAKIDELRAKVDWTVQGDRDAEILREQLTRSKEEYSLQLAASAEATEILQNLTAVQGKKIAELALALESADIALPACFTDSERSQQAELEARQRAEDSKRIIETRDEAIEVLQTQKDELWQRANDSTLREEKTQSELTQAQRHADASALREAKTQSELTQAQLRIDRLQNYIVELESSNQSLEEETASRVTVEISGDSTDDPKQQDVTIRVDAGDVQPQVLSAKEVELATRLHEMEQQNQDLDQKLKRAASAPQSELQKEVDELKAQFEELKRISREKVNEEQAKSQTWREEQERQLRKELNERSRVQWEEELQILRIQHKLAIETQLNEERRKLKSKAEKGVGRQLKARRRYLKRSFKETLANAVNNNISALQARHNTEQLRSRTEFELERASFQRRLEAQKIELEFKHQTNTNEEILNRTIERQRKDLDKSNGARIELESLLRIASETDNPANVIAMARELKLANLLFRETSAWGFDQSYRELLEKLIDANEVVKFVRAELKDCRTPDYHNIYRMLGDVRPKWEAIGELGDEAERPRLRDQLSETMKIVESCLAVLDDFPPDSVREKLLDALEGRSDQAVKEASVANGPSEAVSGMYGSVPRVEGVMSTLDPNERPNKSDGQKKPIFTFPAPPQNHEGVANIDSLAHGTSETRRFINKPRSVRRDGRTTARSPRSPTLVGEHDMILQTIPQDRQAKAPEQSPHMEENMIGPSAQSLQQLSFPQFNFTPSSDQKQPGAPVQSGSRNFPGHAGAKTPPSTSGLSQDQCMFDFTKTPDLSVPGGKGVPPELPYDDPISVFSNIDWTNKIWQPKEEGRFDLVSENALNHGLEEPQEKDIPSEVLEQVDDIFAFFQRGNSFPNP